MGEITTLPPDGNTAGWTRVEGATQNSYLPPGPLKDARTYACLVTPAGQSTLYAQNTCIIRVKLRYTLGKVSPPTQAILIPGGDPAPITLNPAPTVGATLYRFQWFFKAGLQAAPTSQSTAGWTAIAGATAQTFDPPAGLAETRTFACFVVPADSSCGPNERFATGTHQVLAADNRPFSRGTLAGGNEDFCSSPANPTPITFATQPQGSPSFFFEWFFKDGIHTQVPAGGDATGWTKIVGANANTFDPPAGLTVSRSYACRLTPATNSTEFVPGTKVVRVHKRLESYGSLPNSFPINLAPFRDPPNLTMSAAPSGAFGLFTFQWFFRDGNQPLPTNGTTTGWTAIAGATASSYDPPDGLSTTRAFAVFVTPITTCPATLPDWASNTRVFIGQ